MRDFFGVQDATDPLYWIIATNAELAAHVNELWRQVEPYLDARRPQMAARAFHATYFEMYLASVMLHMSIPLVPRKERRTINGGPDLQIADATWIEAITPGEGKTDDRVPLMQYERAMDGNVAMQFVPDRELLLRIQSAIEAKRDVYVDYIRKAYVKEGEPYVIAVSGSALPFGKIDSDIPRIVRVAFGLSELVVEVDPASGAVVSEGYPPLLTIPLKTRDVQLALFARPEYSCISALIWSASDVANRPLFPGRDLVVVHNPNARAALPRGWIRQGREYWAENDELHQRAWFREKQSAG